MTAKLWECLVRPTPRPSEWTVSCPGCECDIPYEPIEFDSGEYGYDPSEWPICADCGAMFEPEAVVVVVTPTERALGKDDGGIQ